MYADCYKSHITQCNILSAIYIGTEDKKILVQIVGFEIDENLSCCLEVYKREVSSNG